MKTVFKILPLVIGFAVLLGMSSASAACSYVGVSKGDSLSFTMSYMWTNSTGSKTLTANLDIVVNNITDMSSYCLVNMTMTKASGGNMTGLMPSTSTSYIPVSAGQTDVNSSTYSLPLINKNVSNKSFYYSSWLNASNWVKYTSSWDGNGVMSSFYMGWDISGYVTVMTMSRPSSTVPGFETWALLLAGGIGIASVISIALKKRH